MSAAQPAPATAPPLSLPLRLNLSVLMFLQFAIWGAWFVVFFPYLTGLNFTADQAGALMGNMALGAIFSTIFAGYIADRLVSSEKLMAICHLAGAALLYGIAQINNPGDYWTLFALTFVYAVVYNPTLVLANSITFEHVPDGQRDFPGIRVLGTLGWIAAGLTIDRVFRDGDKPASASNGPLLLAAGLSAVLGVYSFFLPHTPPKGQAKGIPFVRALGLFKDFSFAVFFIVSLAITVVLAFYYTVTSNFLEKACGVKDTGTTMSIGQVCETVFLPLLPLFLVRLGMKWVLVMGMFCWGLRYLLFANAGPEGVGFALAIAGVALHGFCFDFFFAAGFIHCDNKAPKDIRASAQALFSFLTYGVGMWLGSILCGVLVVKYSDPLTKEVNWSQFWMVPSIGVTVCLVVFMLLFRDRPGRIEEPAVAETAVTPPA